MSAEAIEPSEETSMVGEPVMTDSADVIDPLLVIISGPSGVGKDTIIEALQRRGHCPSITTS